MGTFVLFLQEIQGHRNSPHQPVPVSIANVANIPQQSFAVPIPAGKRVVLCVCVKIILSPVHVCNHISTLTFSLWFDKYCVSMYLDKQLLFLCFNQENSFTAVTKRF